jgi:hypothetical protein
VGGGAWPLPAPLAPPVLAGLVAGAVGPGSAHVERALRPGSVGTPESAVPVGPDSLAARINPVNDVLVYD